MQPNEYRTNYTIDINETYIGKRIKLSGWVYNIRDHGGVKFLDLRDAKGVIQLVSNEENSFEHLTKESSITIEGIVRKRDEDTINEKLITGTIEVLTDSIIVLSTSPHELPFEIDNSKEVNEETRLKYRYLDLRNNKVKKNIIFRSQVLKYLRNKMDSLGFTEVQTPIITASSPEGARDFLIPSRKYKGKFYALPQAPQIYKELLMTGSIDKYYQIAPCFRDEDSRKDRTLEFYQLDFEMSYVNEEDVLKIGEEIFYDTFKEFGTKEVSKHPFKRITYKDALLNYGTDKPDLRNPLIIKDLSDIFVESEFKPFRASIVRGIKVSNIGDKSNSWFNEVVDYATKIGMPGIGYITLEKDLLFKGPIDKFLSEEDKENLIKTTELKPNDVLFFIANKKENTAAKFAGQIRTYLGEKLGLIDNKRFEFCIIKDFPMFEYDDSNKLSFCHNPFSLPHNGIKDYENKNILDILAYQYDFVCNGYEMASGAVRNHDLESLEKGFEVVGYTKEETHERFKSLFTAFKYGVPPHAGMAPGIDRILMLLLDEENLREVQAFPTSASQIDNLMGSPATVSSEQLKELGIKVIVKE